MLFISLIFFFLRLRMIFGKNGRYGFLLTHYKFKRPSATPSLSKNFMFQGITNMLGENLEKLQKYVKEGWDMSHILVGFFGRLVL